MDRELAIKSLQQDHFDLLVVGGGATGTGVALEATTRGLKTALVERGDFGCGTSSRSTKLIHGGVRYLETAVKKLDRGQYKLVKEALHERATLLRIAPHLVKPLALVTPLYRWIEAPYYMAGLRLYDWIAGESGLQKSHLLSSQEALERFPMLKKEGLRGGVVYYDGQFNDARMNFALALTASEKGAAIANHVTVTHLVKTDGRLSGAGVIDRMSGEKWTIPARAIVNATGPFADGMRRLDDPKCDAILSASSGTHIVLDKRFAPPSTGLLIPKTEDGRVLFLLPWLGHTLVGTTDNPAEIEDNPHPALADIEYILRQLSQYFAVLVEKKHILSAWTGLRPLVSPHKAKKNFTTASLSRDHHVEVSDSGLVSITGGKWTTYRRMGIDAVEQAIRVAGLKPASPSKTHELLLAGAEGYTHDLAVRLQTRFHLDEDVAIHLADSYGGRAPRVAELSVSGFSRRLSPDHPFIEAEVIYGAREEAARRATDVLARRLRLFFLDSGSALRALPNVAALLGRELKWDAARVDLEIETARREWAPVLS